MADQRRRSPELAGVHERGRVSKMIIVEEAFGAWRRDPAYRETYDALDEEFTVASVIIETGSVAALADPESDARPS